MIKITQEELIPFMNDSLINEQTFIDFGFTREDVEIYHEDDKPFHYYVLEFDKDGPTLISNDDFTTVSIFEFENEVWNTVGELKMLIWLFSKNVEGESRE